MCIKMRDGKYSKNAGSNISIARLFAPEAFIKLFHGYKQFLPFVAMASMMSAIYILHSVLKCAASRRPIPRKLLCEQ